MLIAVIQTIFERFAEVKIPFSFDRELAKIGSFVKHHENKCLIFKTYCYFTIAVKLKTQIIHKDGHWSDNVCCD